MRTRTPIMGQKDAFDKISNCLEFLVFALVKLTFDRKIEIYIIFIIGKQYNNISKTCMLPYITAVKCKMRHYTPGYSILHTVPAQDIWRPRQIFIGALKNIKI